MKTTLYYFTGTGNSLKIARDLAELLGGTEIIAVAKAVRSESIVSDADAMGIVFPVYMWGVPLVVERFAKKLCVNASAYLFAVANYGGFQAGTLQQMENIFLRRGLTLSAGFGIKMPGNYTPMYGAIPPEKQKELFGAARTKIATIAGQVKNRTRIIEKDLFLVKALFSDIIYRLSAPHIPGMDKDFWSDEKCNACGICEKLCPAGNIKMTNGKPAWQHHCEQCLACLQWCPREAIQFGKNTKTRKRYHHPDVNLVDVLNT